MPRDLTDQQRKELWARTINRTLKGMSPAHSEWDRSKVNSNLEANVLREAFNLNLARELDELYRVCSNVLHYMSEAGPALPDQKAHVKRHQSRVNGIIAQYKDRCKQRKELDGNNAWPALYANLETVETISNREPKKILK